MAADDDSSQTRIVQKVPAQRCLFMELPSEIRVMIYQYAFSGAPDFVTIGAAEVHPRGPKSHSFFDHTLCTAIGLPDGFAAIFASSYRSDLLSVTPSPFIDAEDSAHLLSNSDWVLKDDHTSFRLVNKTLDTEIRKYCPIESLIPETTLFLQYPSGLQLMKRFALHVLPRVKALYVVGVHSPEVNDRVAKLDLDPASTEFLREAHRLRQRDLFETLSKLLSIATGCRTANGHINLRMMECWYQYVQKVELRILLPASSSVSFFDMYSEYSPLVAGSSGVSCSYNCDKQLRGGQYGSICRVEYTKPKELQQGRSVPTNSAFSRPLLLGEGGPGEPPLGSSLVDSGWPN